MDDSHSASASYVSLRPYIKGTSEIISRLLQPHKIRVAHRPISTLHNILTKVKDPVDSFDRLGAIYRIPCDECDATYIGETGRSFNTSCQEHQKAVEINDPRNNIGRHRMDTGNNIDWESSKCLSYC